MNMKKIIPGLIAAFILIVASSGAQAGGNVGWSFSINLNHGHPSYKLHIGNPHRVHYRHRHHKHRHHRRHQKRWHQPRRWHRWGHHHGRHYHIHRHYRVHRHH